MKYSFTIKVKVGLRILVFRCERGWTQEKLAQQSGLDRTYISGVERGRRNISIVNLEKIANALEVHMSEIVS